MATYPQGAPPSRRKTKSTNKPNYGTKNLPMGNRSQTPVQAAQAPDVNPYDQMLAQTEGISAPTAAPPTVNIPQNQQQPDIFSTVMQSLLQGQNQNRETPSEFIKNVYAAQDPVGNAIKMAALPAEAPGSLNPFATGFFKQSAANLSPEAILASQGNTAGNQWAQLGANAGVNPEELKRLNMAVAARR